jgi:DNA polymerase-3 subunit epsilon
MPPSQFPGPIAIIDVETTGLFPNRHDRVVEVAAIVIDGNGRIIREFVSLVNPGRDVGPTSIHGLTAADLLYAPQFGDIAGWLVENLQGTVAIAGHNVRFDCAFIESEFLRIGVSLPELFTICTMQLAGGGRLVQCCQDYGIPLSGETHHALNDARATARLLSTLLPDHPRIVRTLQKVAPIRWPAIPRTGKRPVTRDESRQRRTEPPTYLQRLLGRMQSSAEPLAIEGPLMAYMDLLDRVLEDRHVDESEAEALVEMASKWGLTGSHLAFVHRKYLKELAAAALADGVVTEVERRDLEIVARLLGLENRDLDEVLKEAAAARIAPGTRSTTSERSLRGKRVCFTGELLCKYKGQTITRELAEELATEAGLIVMDSVTKKLDLLVVADPHSQSAKAKKARQYGIRIMHELVFWKAIGVKGIDPAGP